MNRLKREVWSKPETFRGQSKLNCLKVKKEKFCPKQENFRLKKAESSKKRRDEWSNESEKEQEQSKREVSPDTRRLEAKES